MNTLEKLYYGEIRGIEIETSKEYRKASERELKIYEKIKETFHEKDLELFEDFLKHFQESESILQKDLYVLGFKSGLLIGIECAKPENK